MQSEYEQKYTSTVAKLLHNLDRLEDIQCGTFRPISVQLAPTDRCNLSCIFCSLKNREMKELSIEKCRNVLLIFKRMGAKTVEITGGGDPTMYPYINELMDFAHATGYKIGMISNGILINKKISTYCLKKLTWLRVSLNCLDYIDEISLKIPKSVTLGLSYVWNDKSDFSILDKISDYARIYNAKYVRIVPDCLDVAKLDKYKKAIEPFIAKYPGFFLQQKEYKAPSRCWIGYLKPFVNSDGYIYHCSANPLINRKFNEKFRMCSIDNIDAWNNPRPFDTSNCRDGKCFFKEQNDLLEQVMIDIEHRDFI